jgi:hypothetical protein
MLSGLNSKMFDAVFKKSRFCLAFRKIGRANLFFNAKNLTIFNRIGKDKNEDKYGRI